jgi:signal transduction histidine kinase
VTRFEQLVTDLLELASADRRPSAARPTSSRCTASAALARPARRRGGRGTAAVDGDPRVEQLLVNLVDNAASTGAPCGRADVATTGSSEVDDEGPGVPPEERDLVFDRFARGRAASARGGTDGTGLGLALVAQHAAAHRGHVTIGDRPGGGARFSVVLPGDAP